ncbi:hypothetical protein DY000_02031595 [Brassica cretica]|uniref:S-locus glycoprotein domain-containing protein n=1 Tax=Brassica cretica TaxID=69181 RepID=A0ABQ7DQ22_BRACR|nr:hypothetical protein DY000_02031595 [Brassica cretica]
MGAPEIVIWEGETRKWQSGPWDSVIFTGIPDMFRVTNFIYGFKLSAPPERDGSVYFTYVPSDSSDLLRFQIRFDGVYGEIYSDRVLHNTVDKDPSYEEENERLPEEAEDVKSFLFTRWHISNEPPDPGRSEIKEYVFKNNKSIRFVSSNIENHTKKIEQNVLYLTTSGNKFGNVALSFCWESEYELWNVSIVNSTKLFSSSDKARDEKFCEANKRKGSVFCEELYDATRQLNLWNKNYSHGLMCGLSTERVNTAHYPTVFDGFDGLVLFGFCSVWVPLVTDLKVIQFIWMLDPAAQISMIWCAYSTVFISNSLVCNDYQCTWLEHKKWKVSETFNGRTKVYLCGFFGRKMLHCGVLMDLLFGENGKTKHLWPPWVLEFFMGLLQFVPVELECGFSQWRFGDVACEFVCCTNVSCASRKMFCSILVLVSLPQPYGKHVSLSTVSKKAVLDYFHKHVFVVSHLRLRLRLGVIQWVSFVVRLF